MGEGFSSPFYEWNVGRDLMEAATNKRESLSVWILRSLLAKGLEGDELIQAFKAEEAKLRI